MLSRSLLSLAAVAAAAAALFGAALLSPQPASADGHVICIDRAPGRYAIDVPAVGDEPAATLQTTVDEGGEITAMVEPGGFDLVAIGALPGLAPAYANVMTIAGEKVNIVDCPWSGEDAMEDDSMMDDGTESDDAMSLPAGGTGGLLGAASSIGSVVPLIAIAAGAAVSALLAGIGIRRRR